MKKIAEAQFRQTAPDRLELKQGGGCVGCFGIPFFLAGIFMLLITLQIVPLSNAREVPWFGWLILLFMGLVFTGVGSGLVWGRSWISIDKSKHRIWKAWGLLKPMKGEQYSLDNYRQVVLRHNSGDSDTQESYPVALKADNGSTELAMTASQTYGTSLQQARLLATFLNLSLQDLTTDHPVEIKPESVNENTLQSIPEKALDIAPRPEMMKCDVMEEDANLTIRIPGPAFKPYHLIGLLIPLLTTVFIGLPFLSFFQRTHTPQTVSYIFLGFFSFFFILLPIIEVCKAFLLSRTYTTTVKVNQQGIELEYRAFAKKSSQSIPAADILGIDFSTSESAMTSAWNSTDKADKRYLRSGGVSDPHYGTPWWLAILQKLSRSKGVIIKSRKGLISFCQGLPDDEIYHLYTLIKYYLGR